MTTRAFWDIGGTGAKSDACAIWIVQFVGREIRVLDYYEAVGQQPQLPDSFYQLGPMQPRQAPQLSAFAQLRPPLMTGLVLKFGIGPSKPK